MFKINWAALEDVFGFVSLTAREYEDSMALLRRGLAWRREAQESDM